MYFILLIIETLVHILLFILNAEYISVLFTMVRIMMFNGTFNNILVLSWRLVLLVEESRIPDHPQVT